MSVVLRAGRGRVDDEELASPTLHMYERAVAYVGSRRAAAT
jgi:hypothetical protein